AGIFQTLYEEFLVGHAYDLMHFEADGLICGPRKFGKQWRDNFWGQEKRMRFFVLHIQWRISAWM
ncbi:MAG: hypothetical protein SPJ35_03820, partial [Bacteroidaceae bacterium]|nr:hypothetical protein [Bacteroidaceae bacterium]